MRLINMPISFVDVETNGGFGDESRVIEIGIVRVEQNKIVKKFNRLVDPGSQIPYFIEKLTGISNQDFDSAPTFRQISDEVSAILEGSIFVAHSAAFDYGMISNDFKRIGEVFDYPTICTAKLSRALYPDFKRHNLDEIISRHELKVTNRHRAFDDAKALWDFYKCCLAEFELDVIEGAMNKQMRKQTPYS